MASGKGADRYRFSLLIDMVEAHQHRRESGPLKISADPHSLESGALESAVSGKAMTSRYLATGGTPGLKLTDLFAGSPASGPAPMLDEAGRLIALAILSVSAVIDPEKVVLGGGIGTRTELLARITHHLARCMAFPPSCQISALGNKAGALGAVRAARLRLADEYASACEAS